MANFLEILSSIPISFSVWWRIISIFHLAIHGEQFDILSDVLPSINSTFCRATLNPLSWFLSNVSWWKTTRYTKVYYAVLSPSKQY